MGHPWVQKEYSEAALATDQGQYLRLADMSFQLMDLEQALFDLDNAVAQNPYSADALLLRARLKRLLGMETEAMEDRQQAQRINPYAADLYGFNGPHSLLAVMAFDPAAATVDIGRPQKLNYYFEALDEWAASTNYSAGEFELLEDIIFRLEAQEPAAAQELLDDLLNSYPQSPIGWDLQGVVHLEQAALDAAEEAFKKSIQLDSTFAITWYNYSQLENRRGNTQQARLFLDQAIHLQQDLTKAYFLRAALLRAGGKVDLALDDYNHIIEQRSNAYLEAFLNRGLTRSMAGDFSGALEDLNNALEQLPQSSGVLKNRGNLYLLYGYYNLALEDYTRAIQLQPEYAEAYYNRALVHLLLYDQVSACTDLDRSAALGYERALQKQMYFCRP